MGLTDLVIDHALANAVRELSTAARYFAPKKAPTLRRGFLRRSPRGGMKADVWRARQVNLTRRNYLDR